VPRAIFESVGVPGARGHLCSYAEVPGQRLLATTRRQLVDVIAQLPGAHPSPGIDHRQLPHPAVGGVKPLPVQIPHHPTAGISAQRRDRIEPVGGQLTKTLKVRALAAEALQQERGVRDGELVPSVCTAHVAVGRAVGLSELL
jgi:hypothetical protein